MAGIDPPVAADFMLPFLGRASAGVKEVRGRRHASEGGPIRVRYKERDLDPHQESVCTFIISIALGRDKARRTNQTSLK